MNILLCVLGYLACGLLAVLFAGFVDRLYDMGEDAPIGFLFATGPIGLGLSTIALVIILSMKAVHSTSRLDKILNRLYRIGNPE